MKIKKEKKEGANPPLNWVSKIIKLEMEVKELPKSYSEDAIRSGSIMERND